MFNNIGEKIKGMACFVFAFGIVISLIFGLVMLVNYGFSGILVILLGSVLSWILSFVLYGLGQLIENSDILVERSFSWNMQISSDKAKFGRQIDQSRISINGLPDISIPREKIENEAYLGDESINTMTIPSYIKVIGKHAFDYCINLSSVIIEDGVEVIEEGAFRACVELRVVMLGNTIKEIGSYSFSSCSNLQRLTIPYGVVRIGSRALESSNLKYLNFTGTMAQWGKIEKASRWNFGCPAKVVVCTDGEVEI